MNKKLYNTINIFTIIGYLASLTLWIIFMCNHYMVGAAWTLVLQWVFLLVRTFFSIYRSKQFKKQNLNEINNFDPLDEFKKANNISF